MDTLLSGMSSSGHAEGTTQAVVSQGTITVRDSSGQQQDLSGLQRDVTKANDAISPIFDKEKEQNRLQAVQMIGEIGSQVGDIARTEGQLRAIEAGKAELAKNGTKEPEAGVSQDEWNRYNKSVENTESYKSTAQRYGTGSDLQRAITAATAAISGLASGNISSSVAGAAAPYIANEIGKYITPNSAIAGVMAHAVVNAALARAQGQNALVSATGAAAGEATGILLAQEIYGKRPEALTESERQTISALSTLTAGLAGGLAGNSTGSVVSGAQAGKTTVENNALSLPSGMMDYGQAAASWNQYADANNLTLEQKQAGLDKLATGDMPDGTNITKVIVDGSSNMAFAFAAWELGLAASAGKAVGGGILGLAANSSYQVYDLNQPQNANKSWDYLGSATSFTTGMLAPGRGVLANTGIAMGGAFFTDGPNTASLAGAGFGAGLGGAFGKYAPIGVDKVLNGNNIPDFVYDAIGGVGSEFINGFTKEALNNSSEERSGAKK